MKRVLLATILLSVASVSLAGTHYHYHNHNNHKHYHGGHHRHGHKHHHRHHRQPRVGISFVQPAAVYYPGGYYAPAPYARPGYAISFSF